jgi:hypothetical protein
MSATVIETPGGERLVLLPESEYRELLAAARKEAVMQTRVPAVVANRIFSGEHPVRVYREWRGLTARALAKSAGISPGHLSDVENGRRAASETVLSTLAAALYLAPEDLVPARRE